MEEPEIPATQDSPQDADAVPSLGELVAGGVLGGLALMKGLGIAAGIARVAAPAIVGYLAREILDSKAKEPETPVSPAESKVEDPAPTVEQDTPSPASIVEDEDDGNSEAPATPAAVIVKEVPAIWKEDPATPDPDPEDEPVIAEETASAVLEQDELPEKKEIPPTDGEAVAGEEAITDEGNDGDVLGERLPPDLNVADEPAISGEEIVCASSSVEESEETPCPSAEPEGIPVVADSMVTAEPEVTESEGARKRDDDVYGFLEVDEQDEIQPRSGKATSPSMAPSPFLMQDESDDGATSATDDGFPASSQIGSEIEAAAPAEASSPPVAQTPPVAAPIEFPGILDTPVSATAPAAAAPPSLPQGGDHLPPRRSAAPPVVPQGSPGAPSTPPSPPDPPAPTAPEAIIDDTEFDFDPIAIFLQGREPDDEASASSAPEAPEPLAFGTALDDEPAVESNSGETEETGHTPSHEAPLNPSGKDENPLSAAKKDSDLHALFESPIPEDSGRPRVTIPERKTPTLTVSGVSSPTPYRSSVTPHAFAPARTAEAAALPTESAAPSSPFLVAPQPHPETLPALFPTATPEGNPEPHGKRKSFVVPILLALTILACVGIGVFLYLNPDKNPFASNDATETEKLPPLPITPVKPDGSPLPGEPSDRLAILAPESPEAPPLDPPVPPTPPLETSVLPPLSTDDLASITKDPERTLVAFLSVSSNEDRLQLVHLAEGIRERMKAHAAVHGEGPIAYNAAVPKLSGTVPGTSYPTHLFLVTTPSQPNGFPVSVEDTEAGFRVDWDAFVQFNDNLLESFLADPSAPPATFFVVLRRGHFCGEKVPHLEEKLCYRVMSPISAETEQFAFIDTHSPVGEEAMKTLSWGRTFRPIVRLEWIQEGDTEPYVTISEIIRSTWRGSGVGTTTGE
jgi:hypothetical protein